MTVREHLSKISSAEEFFLYLDVPYDPVSYTHLDVYKRQGPF